MYTRRSWLNRRYIENGVPENNENEYNNYNNNNNNNNNNNSRITLLRARSGSQPSENVLSSLHSENRESIEGNIPVLYNRNAGINLLNELPNESLNLNEPDLARLEAIPLVSAAAIAAASRRRGNSLNSSRTASSHGTAKAKLRKRKAKKTRKYRVAKQRTKSSRKLKHSRKQKRLHKMKPSNR